MRILFDLDNTIYDLLGGVEKYFPPYQREHSTTYSFKDVKGLETDELYELFQNPNFFYELEPYQPVVEAIKRLKKEGNDIHFYSLCTNKEVLDVKYDCLVRDLGFESSLIEEKVIGDMVITYDLIVDDNVDRLKDISNLVLDYNMELYKVKPPYFAISEQTYNKGISKKGWGYVSPYKETYYDDLMTLVNASIQESNVIG